VESSYDVVVVGGGAAGLSGALALARARRSVLVVDSGAPRNAPAGGVHNYLGREGTPPGELVAAGRAEVASYGGEVVTGSVTVARAEGGGFRVELDDGTSVGARRLLVTTGLVDELSDVPGLALRWGRDVLHCPYCHGWEVREQSIGVLSTGPMAAHQALLFRQWSSDVTLFLHTGPELTDDRLTGLQLAGGQVIGCRAVVVAPRVAARAEVLTGLGLGTTDLEIDGYVFGSHVAADAKGATSIPGVWVAGNVTDPLAQVISSAAAGLNAAAAINGDLVAEDTADAVTARRHGL